MKTSSKISVLLAVILFSALAAPGVFANCQDPGSYPINQCGRSSWFTPPPAGSGTVSALWWQIGFGNNTRTRTTSNDPVNGVAADGTGFVPVPAAGNCPAGVCTAGLVGTACATPSVTACGNAFIGNDSGLRTTDPNGFITIALYSAVPVGGPAGSLCFGASSNWGSAGSDGCADNARTGLTDEAGNPTAGICDTSETCDVGGSDTCSVSGNPCSANSDCWTCSAGATPGAACPSGLDSECPAAPGTPCNGVKNDNNLNKYWGSCKGLGVATQEYQLDAPMGVLLKESNNKAFALAFLASSSRSGDPTDVFTGDYKFDAIGRGAVHKGDPNPVKPAGTAFDIIPWQNIPGMGTDPNFHISVTLAPDANNAVVSATWTPVRLVDDGSTRPSTDDSLGSATGVGVNDQGALVRHQFRRASITSTGVCSGVGGTCTSGTVGASCNFNSDCTVCGTFANVGSATSGSSLSGVTIPRDSCLRLRTSFGATPATATVNLTNAAQGRLGDLGYDVDSRTMLLGKLLAAGDKASITGIERSTKGGLTVTFSAVELNTVGYEVIGIDAKGKPSVIGKTTCTACSSGTSASYTVEIAPSDLKGSKQVQIKTLPSGTLSDPSSVK